MKKMASTKNKQRMNTKIHVTRRKSVMMNSASAKRMGILLAVVGILVSPATLPAQEHAPKQAAAGQGHGHASPHGGVVKTVGDFHLELGFKPTHKGFQCPMKCEKEKSYVKAGNCPVCKMKMQAHDTGRLEIYVLKINEKEAKPVSLKEVTAQVKIAGGEQYHAVVMTAAPLEGEKEGAVSHFVGANDFLKDAKAFQAVIRLSVDGQSYRAMFDAKAEDFHTKDEHGHGDEGHHEPEHQEDGHGDE